MTIALDFPRAPSTTISNQTSSPTPFSTRWATRGYGAERRQAIALRRFARGVGELAELGLTAWRCPKRRAAWASVRSRRWW